MSSSVDAFSMASDVELRVRALIDEIWRSCRFLAPDGIPQARLMIYLLHLGLINSSKNRWTHYSLSEAKFSRDK